MFENSWKYLQSIFYMVHTELGTQERTRHNLQGATSLVGLMEYWEPREACLILPGVRGQGILPKGEKWAEPSKQVGVHHIERLRIQGRENTMGPGTQAGESCCKRLRTAGVTGCWDGKGQERSWRGEQRGAMRSRHRRAWGAGIHPQHSSGGTWRVGVE